MPRADIDIYANVVRFQKDMEKVVGIFDKGMKDIRRAGDTVRNIFAALGVSIGVGAFAALIKSQIDLQDQLVDLSKRLNISVTDLAGFKYASEQSGASLESFTAAVKHLNKSLSGGEFNPQNNALLKVLGVTSADPAQAIYQLADAFKELGDTPDRTAIALRLLGKSGDEMIPALAGGGEALRALVSRGSELSKITAESAARAKEFNDNLKDMKAASDGAAVEIGNKLLPALISVTNQFAEGVRLAGGISAAFTNFWLPSAFSLSWDGDLAVLKNVNEELAKIQSGEKKVSDEKLKQLLLQKEYFSYVQRQAALEAGKGYENYKGGRETGVGISPTELETSIANGNSRMAAESKRILIEQSGFILGLRKQIATFSKTEFDALRDEARALYNTPAFPDAAERFAFPVIAMAERWKEINDGVKEHAKLVEDAVKSHQHNLVLVEDFEDQLRRGREEYDLQLELLGKFPLEQEKIIALRQIENQLVTQLNVLSRSADPYRQEKMQQLIEQAEIEKRLLSERIEAYNAAKRSFETGLRDALIRLIDDSENSAKQIEQVVTRAFSNMEDAIVQFAKTGKFEFRSFAASVIEDLLRIQIRASITGPFASFLRGLFGGGESLVELGLTNIPQRAYGGPVGAGTTYLVGERGPEWFTPNTNGTIIPNGSMMGGGTYYIDARGADRAGLDQLYQYIRSVDGSIENRSVAATLKARRNSSSFASAFGA